MLRKLLFALGFFAIALSVSSCSSKSGAPGTAGIPTPAGAPAPGPGSSTRFVKATAADVRIPAGGSAEGIVKLTIQNGYHVNANPATFPYLRATEVMVQAGDGVSVGFITYPNPLTKKFVFAEQPLAVYEGDATIKVMLKASTSAAKGPRTLAAKLNVQACDDQVCYPPGTMEFSIPATVK